MVQSIHTARSWRVAHHLTPACLGDLTRDIDVVRDCFRAEVAQSGLVARAMVVLPRSIHGFWILPPDSEPDKILIRFTNSITAHAPGTYVWQSPWIASVLQGHAMQTVEDIHSQPVQWGLVTNAVEWPYSSIHRRAQRAA